MTLKKLLKKLPTIYYYVPPCPNCGSRRTGRFILQHCDTDTDWVVKESLKHGEIVGALPELPEKENCFCLECNHAWYYPVYASLRTRAFVEEEKKERKTPFLLANWLKSRKAPSVAQKYFDRFL